jgi:outer membrane receptor protein involved in Fe transport
MNLYLRIVFSSLIVCILCVYNVNAQSSGKITGKVTDKQSAGIEADVKLMKAGDSVIVNGAKCDASGVFAIENIAYGTYKMEVSFTGYSKAVIDNIVLNAANPIHSFDTLKLGIGDITTDEIDVESEKGLIQLTADKKIFNVDQSALNKGGTALDVLKKTPLVDVDINDNVTLRGSQNVKILVDDKPSRFASLKQVPADAIERIELITNPSAKYEAEGVTGIINIVLKKNDRLGFTGSLNGGGNYTEKVSGWGGLDINLKKKKVTLFGNFYSGTWANNFSYSNTTNYFTQPSSLVTSGNGKNHGYWIWTQGGIEYELSQGKTIGFEGSLGTGKWFNSDLGRNNNLNSLGIMTSFFNQNNDRNGLWENLTGSLYFNNKLDDAGREWTGDITFSRNRNEMKFSLLKQDYDSLSAPANNTPLSQRDTTHIKNYNLNVQTDYTHPLSKTTKIETGYKGTFRVNDNNFSSDTLDYNVNNYITNEATKNHFKLNEYINAVYSAFSGSIKDFNYKLGVRLEQTNTKGELVTNGQNFSKSYLDVFPSVSLSQKIGSANQLQLSYSRRITRPNIWRMNPFVRKWSTRNISVGNPELKPEYTDSYELSFMFFTQAVSITPLLFYRQNHDVITSYSYLVDSNVTLQTFKNAAGSKAYGMDLLLSSRALSWLNLNGTLSLYNTKFDSDPLLTDYAGEEGFSWKANIRSTFTFKGLFDLELYYSYTGKKVNIQGTEIPTSNFDIGISKSFMKDALTVSLKANDIFNTTEWGQDVTTTEYTSIHRNDWSSRQASLNLSFRFGNTDEYYQKKKKVKQNTNEKSDQQDSNGR